MSKPQPGPFTRQQSRRITELLGQVQMLQAQNAELTRLLDAAPRCDRCERTELLRRVLAVNLPGPILTAEIKKTIGEKE